MSQQTFVLVVVINLLGVAGIIVWHLQGRGRPTERLIAQIVFFALMTVALVFAKIMPFHFDAPHLDGSGPAVVAAKILWWTHLSWATIGFVRIYIVLDGRPREARLIQDLLVAVVYLGVLLSVMAFVFGVPIGTLVATSGVLAIILGLALQNTLGDVFSGIALTLGRPYVIGDWILLADGTEGRVVASNWRSTYLLTSGHNQVVLPNSVLAKQSLTNVSRPDETHQIMLPVRIVPSLPPKLVAEVMREALDNCNGVVQDPPPSVSLVDIDKTAIALQLLFRVKSPADRSPARNEVIDMVFRHCMAHGLEIARPAGGQVVSEAAPRDVLPSRSRSIIEAVPMFSRFTPQERDFLAEHASIVAFDADQVIVEEGSVSEKLRVVAAGVVVLSMGGEDLVRLAPGDCLGLRGFFVGKPELHAATARTRVNVLDIPRDIFARMMIERPSLSDDIASWIKETNAAAAIHGGALVQSGMPREVLREEMRRAFGAA
ncbi:mechanosensitive ion channel domain-containing protein [Rhizobium sp. RAF36]|uniref:mechanosensitive ion channel domain-containing protein n=1 Tax=Rhizobium sp. RAF36 TaxID=3233055 RepID=UPI003F9A57D6